MKPPTDAEIWTLTGRRADIIPVRPADEADEFFRDTRADSGARALSLGAVLQAVLSGDLEGDKEISGHPLLALAYPLAVSTTARWLAGQLDTQAAEWQIRFAGNPEAEAQPDQTEQGFFLDFERREIILYAAGMDPAAILRTPHLRHAASVGLAAALRAVWHNRPGIPDIMDYQPAAQLALMRIRTADTVCIACRIAFELRQAGFPGLWRAALGGSWGDMAQALGRMIETDPGSLHDHRAMLKAFRQWYADSDRVRACDHRTLNEIDADLEARMPGESPNPYGVQVLDGQTAAAQACLPGRQSYIAPYGHLILRDPFFAGMEDTINQAHFWHIMQELEAMRIGAVLVRDPKLAAVLCADPADDDQQH